LSESNAIVVGGGISGVSCARRLMELGDRVVLVDRGRNLGGRMATRTLTSPPWAGHVVDIGASYFTVSSPTFRTVVEDWLDRGLAREWTDAFHVASTEGITGVRAGPMRYAATGGLRSLVIDHAQATFDIEQGRTVERITQHTDGFAVDDRHAHAVALCMPVPQAQSLWPVPADHVWEPVIAVTLVFERRCWIEIDGVFVNDDPIITWIADDGRRRGDDAAVLVAHVNPVLAVRHLESITDVLPMTVATVKRILGITEEPVQVDANRWTYARPIAGHDAEFWRERDHRIGVAGDAWFGGPRIEAAWLSGRALAEALR
jgi:renalase